jgi:YidC/Oxa1 family membrane protein insertase
VFGLSHLYNLVARGVIVFHNILAPVFGKHAFFSYAIAIALIVVIVRILIFPLFVRSVRAQRTMQMLQPRIKEIREKYKNDKQRMNQEVMKLQKEHGNPLLGCLPLLLQIPLFISLYHVFNSISRAPTRINSHVLSFRATSGLTGGYYDTVSHQLGTLNKATGQVISDGKAAEVAGLATAKIGGITLSSALTSSQKTLDLLQANGGVVKVVAAIMIVVMAVTVYITQRQIMSRGGPVDPQQQKIQRVMLYGSPLMLAVFGLRFPIAVLVYWLTTNTWSMGQQFFILRKMPPVLPGSPAASATSARTTAQASTGKKSLRKGAAPTAVIAPPPKLTQKRQLPPEQSGESSPDVQEPSMGDAAEIPPQIELGSPASNGSSKSGSNGSGASATGRTVSGTSGSGNRPRPNNRPKGKGPRKGGRR